MICTMWKKYEICLNLKLSLPSKHGLKTNTFILNNTKMKKNKTISLFLLFLSFASLSFAQNNCPALDLPKEDLSKTELKSLLHLYEEEKLAGDVYKTLNEKWNLQVFTNISKAEDHHQSMVAALLDKYEIDYVVNSEIGKFENRELQQLYTELTQKGLTSIDQALLVGATIEDLDIFDLEKALTEEVDNEDISMVYSNLKRGSENHMRAFNRWLSRYAIRYEAQYISAERLNEILSN